MTLSSPLELRKKLLTLHEALLEAPLATELAPLTRSRTFYAWIVEAALLGAAGLLCDPKGTSDPELLEIMLREESAVGGILEPVARALDLDPLSPLCSWSSLAESARLAACLPAASSPGADLFKPLYQGIFAARTRHGGGEHYTPDWLADLVLRELPFLPAAGRRLLDPSCGSGTFLLRAFEATRTSESARGLDKQALGSLLLSQITGFDREPLAVLSARANLAIALLQHSIPVQYQTLPVYLLDALSGETPKDLGPLGAGFDLVAGNPPWVRWSSLSHQERARTLPLWKLHGLFSLRGIEARLGGGEKDLATLFTYVVADRWLRPGGRLGFLVTAEVFRARGAGEGFRHFILRRADPASSTPIRVLGVHDLVALRPFPGTSNKTALILIEKGAETLYPLPFCRWTPRAVRGAPGPEASLEEAMARTQRERLFAWPREDLPGSSWQIGKAEEREELSSTCPFVAHLGVRTDPYGVFWLEILERRDDGLLRVRNQPEEGKRTLESIDSALVESRLVYPLLIGRDIRPFSATPGRWVLFVQDPIARKPIPEPELERLHPHAFGYLSRFKGALLSRGSSTVRALAERTSFYAMFSVGPYTMAPFKVVWRRMAQELVAGVVSTLETPFGARLVLPSDTISFFPMEQEREAHFVCALLNSGRVRSWLRSVSSAGRGFGTPSAMRGLGIPRFQESLPLHAALADLSLLAHQDPAGCSQEELDRRVRGVFE